MLRIKNLNTFRWEWWKERDMEDRPPFHPQCVRLFTLEISCGEKAREYAEDYHHLWARREIVIPRVKDTAQL